MTVANQSMCCCCGTVNACEDLGGRMRAHSSCNSATLPTSPSYIFLTISISYLNYLTYLIQFPLLQILPSIEEDVLLELYKRIGHSITNDMKIRKDHPDEHAEGTHMLSTSRTLLGNLLAQRIYNLKQLDAGAGSGRAHAPTDDGGWTARWKVAALWKVAVGQGSGRRRGRSSLTDSVCGFGAGRLLHEAGNVWLRGRRPGVPTSTGGGGGRAAGLRPWEANKAEKHHKTIASKASKVLPILTCKLLEKWQSTMNLQSFCGSVKLDLIPHHDYGCVFVVPFIFMLTRVVQKLNLSIDWKDLAIGEEGGRILWLAWMSRGGRPQEEAAVRLELPRCWRRGQEAAELALFFIFPCDGLNPEIILTFTTTLYWPFDTSLQRHRNPQKRKCEVSSMVSNMEEPLVEGNVDKIGGAEDRMVVIEVKKQLYRVGHLAVGFHELL